jgi:hypothetical protein
LIYVTLKWHHINIFDKIDSFVVIQHGFWLIWLWSHLKPPQIFMNLASLRKKKITNPTYSMFIKKPSIFIVHIQSWVFLNLAFFKKTKPWHHNNLDHHHKTFKIYLTLWIFQSTFVLQNLPYLHIIAKTSCYEFLAMKPFYQQFPSLQESSLPTSNYTNHIQLNVFYGIGFILPLQNKESLPSSLQLLLAISIPHVVGHVWSFNKFLHSQHTSM